MEASFNFDFSDHFDCALSKFIEKLKDEDRELLNGVSRLFRPSIKDSAWFPRLVCDVHELWYWRCLRKILIHIDKCSSNADKIVPNWGYLVINFDHAFSQIAEDITGICRYKSIAKRSFETLGVFRDSFEKIFRYLTETGQALRLLSSSCCSGSLDWHLPSLARSLHDEFRSYISEILGLVAHKIRDDQRVDGERKKKIENFKSDLFPLLDFIQAAAPYVGAGYPSDGIIIHNNSTFLAHIACVAVRIAFLSYDYWTTGPLDSSWVIRSISGLLDLHQEIDPVTHQVQELALRYLRAVNGLSPGRTEHLASSFLNYTLARGGYQFDDFEWKLKPLMIFVINEWEEPHSEDVQGLFAEIEAVLMIARFYCSGMQFDRLPFELDARICLLNAEVFLKQQLKSSSISMEDKVEELNRVITCLRTFSHQQQLKIENARQSFTFIDQVAGELASLYQSFHDTKITEHNLRIAINILLLNIVFRKAESTCMDFLEGNAIRTNIKNEKNEILVEGLNLFPAFVTNEHEKIQTLLEGLNLLRAFATNQQEEMTEGVELIFTHIEAIARGITCFSYSFLVDIGKKRTTSFADLEDKITHIKAELREICPVSPRSNFPKIYGIGFMDSLLENLLELIKLDPESIALVKHLIERIPPDIEFLAALLMKQDAEHLQQNDLCTRVMYAAYEVEYVIDSIEAGIGDHWQHLLQLYDVLEEIRLIKVQATITYGEKTNDATDQTVAQISGNIVSRAITPEIGEPMICLSDEEEVIINQLTRGSSQRDIISVIGMPGIGKTTLAKKVYDNPRVTFHFHIRAWCAVSQVYDKRELLLDLLCNISGLNDDIQQMTNEDLELKLYQRLKQKRYLIVMDDVWDNGALTVLEGSFPNDGNGSRILMTSRLRDVALKAKPDSDPHSLRLPSDDESWKLLQTKIFQEGCPDELVEVGKEIAMACKGLPLAVVAIAGVLERTEKKQEKWKEIAKSLSSRIIDDPQTQCMGILQLSYKNLPDHLKACFLYFGVFLEDKNIPVCKLIRLWIAEGFIQKTLLNSLEDLAEDYLMELIGRSLITVSRTGSRGKVKECHIHDLLRDLCLSKAKEVNFLQQITGDYEPSTSLSAVDFDDDFYDYHPPNPVTYEKHRVCICLKRNHFILSSPCDPCCRSLLFFAVSDRYPRRPFDISFIPRHFKLLRVLDLETINMGHSFPKGIEYLVQLRYLALSGDIEYIPPSIVNLRKLETLIFKGLKGKVILPDSLWSMARLRHIYVNDFVDFILGDDELESSLQLDKLVSFSSPRLSHGKDAEKIIRRFPNLRKLRCVFVASWDPSRNCYKLPELQYLIQLESLKIFYSGVVLKPLEFTLPWNLKKLTLSNFWLPWTHISAVGRLEKLEVLKLLFRAFEGRRWDMRDGEFLKLKYLELDTLNIAQWNASNDHLPNLQQLVLRNCKDLEEVPYAFREISTLQMIEVQSCKRSTEESVRSIQEEGIEGIRIIIQHNFNI